MPLKKQKQTSTIERSIAFELLACCPLRFSSAKKAFRREWHTQGSSSALRAESTSRLSGALESAPRAMLLSHLETQEKHRLHEDQFSRQIPASLPIKPPSQLEGKKRQLFHPASLYTTWRNLTIGLAKKVYSSSSITSYGKT